VVRKLIITFVRKLKQFKSKEMTTRKGLQEWLNKFPEDTIIEFGIQQQAALYQSYGDIVFDTPKLDDNDLGDGWAFMDFRTNKFVKPDAEHFGKCYLRIGESC
jgi:hypothetical protein